MPVRLPAALEMPLELAGETPQNCGMAGSNRPLLPACCRQVHSGRVLAAGQASRSAVGAAVRERFPDARTAARLPGSCPGGLPHVVLRVKDDWLIARYGSACCYWRNTLSISIAWYHRDST